jgi:hypothetical protein
VPFAAQFFLYSAHATFQFLNCCHLSRAPIFKMYHIAQGVCSIN